MQVRTVDWRPRKSIVSKPADTAVSLIGRSIFSHAKKETLWPVKAVAFGAEASTLLWTQFSSAGEASDNAFKSH
jgi:hypothetical protein